MLTFRALLHERDENEKVSCARVLSFPRRHVIARDCCVANKQANYGLGSEWIWEVPKPCSLAQVLTTNSACPGHENPSGKNPHIRSMLPLTSVHFWRHAVPNLIYNVDTVPNVLDAELWVSLLLVHGSPQKLLLSCRLGSSLHRQYPRVRDLLQKLTTQTPSSHPRSRSLDQSKSLPILEHLVLSLLNLHLLDATARAENRSVAVALHLVVHEPELLHRFPRHSIAWTREGVLRPWTFFWFCHACRSCTGFWTLHLGCLSNRRRRHGNIFWTTQLI